MRDKYLKDNIDLCILLGNQLNVLRSGHLSPDDINMQVVNYTQLKIENVKKNFFLTFLKVGDFKIGNVIFTVKLCLLIVKLFALSYCLDS